MITNKNQTKSKASLISLAFISVLLFSVISCKNQEENPPAKANVISAVSVLKMNIMYLGVDNPINVAISGYNSNDLEVTVDNGEITGSDGNYIVRAAKKGILKVTISSKSKKIEEKEFRVKRVPNPKASILFGHVFHSNFATVPLKRILQADSAKMVVQIENFDFDFPIELRSFMFSYSSKKNNSTTVYEHTIKTNSLNFKSFKDFKPEVGRKFYIEKIKVSSPDGTTRMLAPIILEVV